MSKITDARLDEMLARVSPPAIGWDAGMPTMDVHAALTELRALRSKSEAEPFGWWVSDNASEARMTFERDAEKRRQRTSMNRGAWTETALYTHPAPQEAVGVKAVGKMIMLEMQGHDFGYSEANGDFTCTVAQIGDLERCCNAAATLASLPALTPQEPT